MDVICSPSGIVESKRPRGGLNKIRQAGFDEIVLDFNMFTGGIASSKHHAEVLEHWREWMQNYMAEAQLQGLKSGIAVAPHFVKEQKIPNMEILKSDLLKGSADDHRLRLFYRYPEEDESK